MLQSHQSPNFNERGQGVRPSMIILHYTGMKTAKAAIERLCDPSAEVSAHYLIEENGKLHQLVDDQYRAWHAGKSYWNGIQDVNAHSIGIELVNPGHEFGYRPFPDKQIAALISLCKSLIKKYNIPAAYILGHSDVATSRKKDPGELFPWEELAVQGIGLWPHPEEMDYEAAKDIMFNLEAFESLLGEYGYHVENHYAESVIAFHRHFYPKKLLDHTLPDVIDEESVARLLSLIRQRHEN